MCAEATHRDPKYLGFNPRAAIEPPCITSISMIPVVECRSNLEDGCSGLGRLVQGDLVGTATVPRLKVGLLDLVVHGRPAPVGAEFLQHRRRFSECYASEMKVDIQLHRRLHRRTRST